MRSSLSALLLFVAIVPIAAAQNVKVMPLGSHTGELCDRDRATLFEDPSGVSAACLAGAKLGGTRTFRTGTGRAVEITVVFAAHDSTVSRDLLTDPEKKDLEADKVSLVPPTSSSSATDCGCI